MPLCYSKTCTIKSHAACDPASKFVSVRVCVSVCVYICVRPVRVENCVPLYNGLVVGESVGKASTKFVCVSNSTGYVLCTEKDAEDICSTLMHTQTQKHALQSCPVWPPPEVRPEVSNLAPHDDDAPAVIMSAQLCGLHVSVCVEFRNVEVTTLYAS